MKKYIIICVLSSLLWAPSCEEFLELGPPNTSLVSSAVYENDALATAVLTGVYYDFAVQQDFIAGERGLSLMGGLSADEFLNYTTSLDVVEVYTNSLSATNSVTSGLWRRGYNLIYIVNDVLENITDSDKLSPHVRDQLVGESKFVRAFVYFYLTNMYGDVPLLLSTDYKANATKPRNPVSEVYAQIIQDLEDAQELLLDDYQSAENSITSDRVRPNKVGAEALLARVHLYLENWMQAETYSSGVINRGETHYKLEDDLNSVFLVNSKEAIWQVGIASNNGGINTMDGYTLKIVWDPSFYGQQLSASFLGAFADGDQRRNDWVGTFLSGGNTFYYPYKYKVHQSPGESITEHLMVLRLGEQYLIRAEARARQGKLYGVGSAQEDVNAIRTRAGLDPIDPESFTEDEMMAAIEQERRVELFSELGHRWFDLKRWVGFSNAVTRADEVMPNVSVEKGGVWRPEAKLFPIPHDNRLSNVNLSQNPGYEQ
ncbi:RagB/SusD family nutrient uptake outer membrane protein [Belliella marina]|uniref:RagB/SusD family nutrient uptake outer membrane protein n=1 Tax=Belliella marina TaxID=1644146 RepID=A0ABW4VPK9_9BACT